MHRIILVLLCALGFGALLALGTGALPLRTGLVGMLVMLAVALAPRRRWLLLADAAPGSPERALWVGLASTAVVAGHLLASWWQIGPNMIMHSPAMHALGTDNWTLVAGALFAYWIARDPQPREDERDRWIAARGLRLAYYGLLSILIVQILALGFVNRGWVTALSNVGIAHGLILAIMASVIIDHGARLQAYASDAAFAAATDP